MQGSPPGSARIGASPATPLARLDDPQEVFVLFDVTDLEKARAFISSPNVPEAQRKSGLLEKPQIYFMQ